jgi:hypothetical protein
MLVVVAILAFGATLWWWRASLVPPAPNQPTAAAEEPAATATAEFPRSKQTPTPAQPAEPLSAADTKFLARLQQAELTAVPFGFSQPYGFVADDATLAEVAAGRVAETVSALEARAAAGDNAANAALAQLKDCSFLESAGERVAGAAQRVIGSAATVAAMPEERRKRMRLVADVRHHHFEEGLQSCRRAQFNGPAIDQRLRDAAAAGDETSLWVMGKLREYHDERMKSLAAAAMLGHARAQYEMGIAYRGGYTGAKRHGPKEKVWLELAAPKLPNAKEALAECYFEGCDGRQPDPDNGLRLLAEAALLGHGARVEQMRPVGAGEALPAEQRFALAEFRNRLNESGCFGVSGYVRVGFDSWETEQLMQRSLSNFVQQQVRTLADQYWRDHGASARTFLGCS